MQFTINSENYAHQITLDAYHYYSSGDYAQALPLLQSILDIEPNNWHARLFIGACYFKMGQPASSLRAFRFVYDRCPDPYVKKKACLALQSVKADLEKNAAVPEELSAHLGSDLNFAPRKRLDEVII